MIDHNSKVITHDSPGRWLIVPYIRSENGRVATKVYEAVGIDNGVTVWEWIRSEEYFPDCDNDDCEICKNENRPRTDKIPWEEVND